jgi:hypothetical protein
MKHFATVIGTIVILTIGSPVFVWLGTKFIVDYGTYVSWINSILSGIGR